MDILYSPFASLTSYFIASFYPRGADPRHQFFDQCYLAREPLTQLPPLHKSCVLGVTRYGSLSSRASHTCTFKVSFLIPVEAFLHGCAHLGRADYNWHNPT